MNRFFNSCRKFLNPWVIGTIIVVVVGLIVFVPIIGVTVLIAALPLIGCTVMCGAMAFFVKGNTKKDKE